MKGPVLVSVPGPLLAPRPAGGRSVPSPAVSLLALSSDPNCLTHNDAEWTAAYPEIERLYVRERRKLRHVMQYMESKHNFKATVQMYKKRFAKWGFQKNARRQPKSIVHTPAAAMPIHPLPSFGPQDTLSLLLLTTVRTWSVSFFEAPFSVQHSAHQAVVSPAKAKEISFAFKLVMDLLERGRGDLAGRTARKAFLLVEDMIETLAAPALMWNLLEMMHYMVSLQQTQLFQMLLAHVSALVVEKQKTANKLPAGHPLLALLQGLRGIAADVASLGDLLAQAWTLNAEILFSNFHPRLVDLYCCILWESCSIGPPAAIVDSVAGWFRTIDAVHVAQEHEKTRAAMHKAVQQAEYEKSPHWPNTDKETDDIAYSPYARLHASSLAALRAHGDAIIKDGGAGFQGDTALLLRMLAGLTTAKILQGMPDTTSVIVQLGEDESWDLVGMPRVHLGNVACVIRTLVEIDRNNRRLQRQPTTESEGSDSERSEDSNSTLVEEDGIDSMGMVEQIRAVVHLRTQSDGPADPQVMREMWLLQDALEAIGEREEALLVEQEAYERVEMYVKDIPANAA
ncbi:hypothetical protein SEUCBS139899_002897 [Sporothrix eucalyptigena]|uniref:Clr5 domain-containing protein n=1 Tax=Sporothrix eucalyptigena TaxID=1812306 RepID=A0ABP0BY80_9PEZI